MQTIAVNVDAKNLILRLENGQRRLGYAVVNAINNTAKRIQQAERRRVEEKFTVRKRDFILREAAIIKPFASVGRSLSVSMGGATLQGFKAGQAFAEIGVGQKPRLLLSMFERGDERGPFTKGAKHVAIPVIGSPARPSKRSSVPPALHWKALRLQKTRVAPWKGTTKSGRARRTKAKASGIRRGEHGTYFIPGVGVFQRKSHSGTRRLIYSLKESVHLKPQLKFVETAESEADKWFHEEMEREVVDALAHAMRKGL